MSAQSSDTPLFDQLEDAAVEYREIPGFPGYRAGDDGSVWSRLALRGLGRGKGTVSVFTATWKRLRQHKDKAGYRIISLSVDRNGSRKSCSFLVHRLVLLAFVGPPPEGMECCHQNSVRDDCRLSNLRWDTPKANIHDEIERGTFVMGSRNGRATLHESQVAEVKKRIRAGIPRRIIVAEIGLSVSQYKEIQGGRSWRHVL